MIVRLRSARWKLLLPLAVTALAVGGALAAASADEAQIDWKRARQHWAFQPPQARPLPPVHQKNWPCQPLDAFILARLEKAGLSPSPEADPRTLIRRVTFDLTGLPPMPEEVDSFVTQCGVRNAECGMRNRPVRTHSALRTPHSALAGAYE